MSLRVYIVDDEEPARERLKELLGDLAAELPTRVVGEARHGLEALEQVPGSGAPARRCTADVVPLPWPGLKALPP